MEPTHSRERFSSRAPREARAGTDGYSQYPTQDGRGPVDYDNFPSGSTDPSYGSSWGTNSTPQGYRHNPPSHSAAASHRERSWHRPRAFRPGELEYQDLPDDLLPPPSPQASQLHGTGMMDRHTIMGGFQSPFGIYTPGGTSIVEKQEF